MIRGLALKLSAYAEKEKKKEHADPLTYCARCGSTFSERYNAQVLCDHCLLERMQEHLESFNGD